MIVANAVWGKHSTSIDGERKSASKQRINEAETTDDVCSSVSACLKTTEARRYSVVFQWTEVKLHCSVACAVATVSGLCCILLRVHLLGLALLVQNNLRKGIWRIDIAQEGVVLSHREDTELYSFMDGSRFSTNLFKTFEITDFALGWDVGIKSELMISTIPEEVLFTKEKKYLKTLDSNYELRRGRHGRRGQNSSDSKDITRSGAATGLHNENRGPCGVYPDMFLLALRWNTRRSRGCNRMRWCVTR